MQESVAEDPESSSDLLTVPKLNIDMEFSSWKISSVREFIQSQTLLV